VRLELLGRDIGDEFELVAGERRLGCDCPAPSAPPRRHLRPPGQLRRVWIYTSPAILASDATLCAPSQPTSASPRHPSSQFPRSMEAASRFREDCAGRAPLVGESPSGPPNAVRSEGRAISKTAGHSRHSVVARQHGAAGYLSHRTQASGRDGQH